jgi:hypothetical protein
MPERKYLHLVAMNSVVKMVVNSSKVNSPHVSGLGIQRRGSDGGLCAKQQECFSQFLL